MEVRGHVLKGISTLRCLSITEIIFGVLGAIGIIYLTVADPSRWSDSRVGGSISTILVTALLLAAGSFGVHAVNKVRSHILDANTFRVCGILNIVTCVLYCLQVFVLALGGILLAVNSTTGLHLLAHFGIVASAASTEAEISGIFWTDFRMAIGGRILIMLSIAVFICLLMIALTATAAKIARQNQAIIMAGPSGAVAGYPLVPPGYTQYSPVKTQEMHHT